MPKIKTHKGAAKRFTITRTGKIQRENAFANHLLEHKSPDQKRNYDGKTLISTKGERKNIKKQLGVG
jgi:large subunit ribosomal protein L35